MNGLFPHHVLLSAYSRAYAALLGVVVLSAARAQAADEPNPATAHTTKAMALLRANCVSCHNPDKKKGGLLLTTREAALKGGDNGAVIMPGNASDSAFIKSLAAGADPHMPPKKQLLERQITTLRAWVEAGAEWDEAVLNAVTTVAIPEDYGPLPAGYQPALALALSPDDKLLAIGRGNEVFIHDLVNKERPLIRTLTGHRDVVQSLAFSGDGKRLASGGFRRVIQWSTAAWEQSRTLTNDLGGRITALAFTPDHQTLVAADSMAAQSGWVRTFKADDGSPLASWQAHGDSIFDMAISGDGKLLATAGADRVARLWEWASRKDLATLERHQGHVLALAFNPDGTWLATGSTDTDMKVWDTKTHQEIINAKIHPEAITGIKWAADGKSLATTCEDGLARTFNDFKVHGGSERSDGAREKKLSSVEEVLNAVALSKDARTIYGAGQSGTVYVWSSDGKVVAKLAAPKAEVASIKKAAK